jgi:protein pelota
MSKIKKDNDIRTVIIAGTGFEKENFHRFLSEKYPELAGISVVESIGSHGKAGINEVMKRPILKRVGEELGAIQDSVMLDELLAHVGKDTGLGIYGIADVENAAGLGAIEKLLICDDFLQNERDRIEIIIKTVKSAKGRFHIINHESDAGKQLNSLGGIAAILRFKIR